MNLPETELSALVSARLCHDLVSPLGAIGNGLELVEMSAAAPAGPELALVSDSLSNAIGKLKFLRIAFGPAEPSVHLSFEEATNVTAAAFPGRYSVLWSGETGSMPRPLAKAVCLAILCLEKSLPLGGEVRVIAGEDQVDLSVGGRRTAPPAALWAHVTEGDETSGDETSGDETGGDGTGGDETGLAAPDAVQFILLRACLDALGGRITARFTESGASLRLSVPAPAPA